jgi:apolipoprotein N-acyltransferase
MPKFFFLQVCYFLCLFVLLLFLHGAIVVACLALMFCLGTFGPTFCCCFFCWCCSSSHIGIIISFHGVSVVLLTLSLQGICK